MGTKKLVLNKNLQYTGNNSPLRFISMQNPVRPKNGTEKGIKNYEKNDTVGDAIFFAFSDRILPLKTAFDQYSATIHYQK